MESYLSELENCNLCEWQCGKNRLNGELGVCGVGIPNVASAMLHPAPPRSYTVFLSGCNFKCLNCQNWEIAHSSSSEGGDHKFRFPEKLGKEVYEAINSPRGRRLGADRVFFSGGAPTPSLPYIEEVVREARNLGDIKVNYDTNGFMTIDSLKRIVDFATSITFDIKAYHEDTHRALTGAPVEPVLRNAEYVAKNAKDKLWEFRVLMIPGISKEEVRHLSEFLSEIDPSLPLNFLAFRPNFVLESYSGSTRELMEKSVEVAKEAGLRDVSWSGRVGLPGRIPEVRSNQYESDGAKIAGAIAENVGCLNHPRNCGECNLSLDCPVKKYEP